MESTSEAGLEGRWPVRPEEVGELLAGPPLEEPKSEAPLGSRSGRQSR